MISRFFSLLFALLIAAYVFFIQLMRLNTGWQGIDFAIFAQVIDQVSKHGIPLSSLIDIRWQNFLTHHSSLFFYPLGFFNSLIKNASLTLILAHSINVFFLILLLQKISKHSSWVLLFCLNPSFRIPILWEAHDENFAITFLVAAIWFFINSRHKIAVVMLLLAMLFKETMFFFSAYLAFLAALYSEERKTKKYYLCLCSVGIFFLVMYLVLLPRTYFVPTFSGISRICSLEQLFNYQTLKLKFIWFCKILFCFFPLIRSKKTCLYFVLLALPFFLPILISNFDSMYYPYNYYSINPFIMLFVSVVLSTKIEKRALVFCIFLTLILNQNFIWPKEIINGLSIKPDSIIAKIPKKATLIVGDFDASFFVENDRLIRIFHANSNITNFDFIIQRKHRPIGEPEKLSLFLRSWSKVCYEDSKWLVRCAMSRFKASDAKI